jgi:hypothetical protein
MTRRDPLAPVARTPRHWDDVLFSIPGRIICAVILAGLEFRDRHHSPSSLR